MKINTNDYINELLYCIKAQDSIKTDVLLQNIDKVDLIAQKRLIFELAKEDDTFTIPMLKSLLLKQPKIISKIPELRNVLMSKFIGAGHILADFISIEKCREELLSIASEIRCEEVLIPLSKLINETQDIKLIINILNTFGNIGNPSIINSVTEHLYSQNKDVIIAAVSALRLIGTSHAVLRLFERLGSDKEIDMLILDSFSTIQSQTALEKLNNTLISHTAFTRNYGKEKLIEIGAKVIPMLIDNLKYNDSDLLIHTLNVLSEIGDETTIKPIKKFLLNEPKDANTRFAAYEALGELPLDKNAYILSTGLEDPIDNVCSAAAKAINKNYSHVLSIGISNLLNNANVDSKRMVQMIIMAKANNIFADKIEDEKFLNIAKDYLKSDIPKELRTYYINILRNKGNNFIADDIEKNHIQNNFDKNTTRIVIVDDSRMILGIYKTTIHKLGYKADLFEFPKTAITDILSNKPDIVITDLNMPEITGIELAKQIRTKFSKKDLPIIMVTTQNESQDNKAAYDAGINIIIHKPFTEISINDAIQSIL